MRDLHAAILAVIAYSAGYHSHGSLSAVFGGHGKSSPSDVRELEAEIDRLRDKFGRINYFEARRRHPQFKGPFPVAWDKQWDCVPIKMRYEFSMSGKIAKSPGYHGVPSEEGAPQIIGKEASNEGSGISDSQIPDVLWNGVMKYRGGVVPIWTKEVVDLLVSEIRAGRDISCQDYPDSATDVEIALRIVGVSKEKKILVGGSISPWVEAVALSLGAGKITTSDYNPAESQHPNIRTISVPDLLKVIYGTADNGVENLADHQYDIVVSYSSVEHDGLGRYGDPFDPVGDFQAMKELYDMTAPGGTLLLAVPAWYQDQQSFSSARVYGPLRLPRLINQDEWEYLGTVLKGSYHHNVPLAPSTDCDGWGWHPILMLRKAKQESSGNRKHSGSSSSSSTSRSSSSSSSVKTSRCTIQCEVINFCTPTSSCRMPPIEAIMSAPRLAAGATDTVGNSRSDGARGSEGTNTADGPARFVEAARASRFCETARRKSVIPPFSSSQRAVAELKAVLPQKVELPADVAANSSVTLFEREDCSGRSVTIKADQRESKCKHCVDFCGREWGDGTPMHSVKDYLTKMPKAVKVRGGASLLAHTVCHGHYTYAEGTYPPVSSHSAGPAGAESACQRLASGTSHLAFTLAGAAAVTKAETVSLLRGTEKPRPGLSQECGADKEKFCKNVKPGGGRTHECIKSHRSKLSKACAEAEFGKK